MKARKIVYKIISDYRNGFFEVLTSFEVSERYFTPNDILYLSKFRKFIIDILIETEDYYTDKHYNLCSFENNKIVWRTHDFKPNFSCDFGDFYLNSPDCETGQILLDEQEKAYA
ncbi:hypothetical protein QNI16_23540 [Cytophagaceae bacterium YF14B1]|uniref:Uncharacterized protein n=1 Tax=Xanthocytophaga flava TaxID=3048013 RepID=A0AAE3QQ95_9BACT|nr:hypothetical protein [Xanthocytophaga flavus]MDJ1483492.1 hypothetical protein [Xanthocytophaga flavus]